MGYRGLVRTRPLARDTALGPVRRDAALGPGVRGRFCSLNKTARLQKLWETLLQRRRGHGAPSGSLPPPRRAPAGARRHNRRRLSSARRAGPPQRGHLDVACTRALYKRS